MAGRTIAAPASGRSQRRHTIRVPSDAVELISVSSIDRFRVTGPSSKTAPVEVHSSNTCSRSLIARRWSSASTSIPILPSSSSIRSVSTPEPECVAKWDANSLIILRRALLGFDTRPDFAKIKAMVLYVLCRTDALFPPKIAPGVMQALAAAGVEARYFELDSELGHSSSGAEHAKWSPVLREFLAPLVARV